MYNKYGIELLKKKIKNALRSPELSGYEMGFLDDILVMITVDDVYLKLTKKQDNKLQKIIRKTGAYKKSNNQYADDYLNPYWEAL